MADKRAVIFVNGILVEPEAVMRRLLPQDFLIAADGGLQVMHTLGLQPRLLIGDLDSVSPAEVEAVRAAGGVLRSYPVEKDETDLELALLAAAAGGFAVIWLVAALGGRLDQTLANINLLLLPELSGRQIFLFDGREEVFLIRDVAEIHGQPGEVVSLLPLNGPAAGITTHGLQFPLRGETLFPERSRGISNRLRGSSARVELESGVLLCIHTHAK